MKKIVRFFSAPVQKKDEYQPCCLTSLWRCTFVQILDGSLKLDIFEWEFSFRSVDSQKRGGVEVKAITMLVQCKFVFKHLKFFLMNE